LLCIECIELCKSKYTLQQQWRSQGFTPWEPEQKESALRK